MKTKSLKKLGLIKSTIVRLDKNDLPRIKGGDCLRTTKGCSHSCVPACGSHSF